MLELDCKLQTTHEKELSCVRFSSSGDKLATSSADRSIRFWELKSIDDGGKQEWIPLDHILRGHTKGISDINWSPDSRYLCSASDDTTVMIWSVANAKCVRILRGHSNVVFCAAFSPLGTIVASGSFDETIRIWDIKNERCIRAISAHSDPISCLSFNGDGTILASCSYDGLVRLWKVDTGQCLKTLVGDDNPPVSFVKFTPNSKYLLVSTLDNYIRLWDHQASKCLRAYSGHLNERFCCIADFLTTELIVAGGEDGNRYVWNIQDGALVEKRECSIDHTVLCISVHQPTGRLALCSVDNSKQIQIWKQVA